jgi:exonuclease VII small subunit
MKKPKNNKSRTERGTVHLAETVKRLEKRVAALERARKRDENWPEIIPMDDEAREIFERGMEDVRAGRLTPAFKSMAELKAWNKRQKE